MTTETSTNLPPCPLPGCEGGEHHYHDIETYTIGGGHDCASTARSGYRCYGPHQPGTRWEPIERDEIKAGMRIRATAAAGDCITTHTGVTHHTNKYGDWLTERSWLLTGWADQISYEVDPATVPDPDAELIEALREASWRIEHMGGRPDPLPGLPEARDLLNKLRELGWTVIRESEATA